MQKILSQNIVENINAHIMQLKIAIKDIRAIKKLSSKNIAIYTINKEKAIKLGINNVWIIILERKAKAIILTYAIIINKIKIKK